MRARVLTLFAVAFAAVACTPKPPGERFYGSWVVKNQETLALDPTVSALSPIARKRLQKVTAKWMSTIRFTFEKTGQLTVVFANAKSTYRFKVTRVGRDDLELSVKDTAGPEDQRMLIRYQKKTMRIDTPAQRWVLERD